MVKNRLKVEKSRRKVPMQQLLFNEFSGHISTFIDQYAKLYIF